MTETPVEGPPNNAERGDLLLIAGHGQLFTQVIERAEIVIGREPGCDLRVDYATLSRRHAILRLGPPMTIQDLGSTNGVRVSGRVHKGGEPVLLEPGESFHLGGFSFNFIGKEQQEASSSHRAVRDRLRIDDPTLSGVPSFVRDLALSSTSALILGESGTGKDVLAETIHTLSGRTGELLRINCAALSEPLIESELFGHERGSFTGALSTKVGLLEAAEGGTVFLDELGDLPLALQAKLLRAIESREILRIGSIRPTRIDVRFISATNRDLPAEVAAKRFRADLYFRVDGITLELLPLRARKERILALASSFFEHAAGAPVSIAPEVFAALRAHDWPGNVRELKAVVERAVLLARGAQVQVGHLVFAPKTSARAAEELSAEELARREELVEALARCAQNQTRAAKLLGISRTTLVQRMKLLRIARPRS